MNFLDINTFYYASDGGVKTFYDAKIQWFKKHPEHQYILVFPNSTFKIEKVAPNIHTVQVYGLKGLIGKNRLLMVDYWKVLKLIRKMQPDVIEIGDPLLTPFLGVFIRRSGMFKGLLSSFHHSDPINTYVVPWAYGKNSTFFKRFVARLCQGVYLFNHKRIPYSMVASQTLKQKLQKMAIPNIVVKPFGVQDIFYKKSYIRRGQEKNILFAGRLEHEKGIHLFKNIINRLLEIEDVNITVMGKGAHENFFKDLNLPRFKYPGDIADREKVASVYKENTFFLAPGPFETFGIAVLEAMANGMIIIGADKGGTGELLASMNSPFIFEAHNTESFYKTIIKALNSDYEAESRRSINKSRDFSTWEAAIGYMIQYYIDQTQEKPAEELKKQEQENPTW